MKNQVYKIFQISKLNSFIIKNCKYQDVKYWWVNLTKKSALDFNAIYIFLLN